MRYTQCYPFVSCFSLLLPLDVKLTKEHIFVLSKRKPFLSAFDYDFQRVHDVIFRDMSKQLIYPRSFVIDGVGSFVISDYGSSVVWVFDTMGEVLHRISQSVSYPIGVKIGSLGSITVIGFSHYVVILQ